MGIFKICSRCGRKLKTGTECDCITEARRKSRSEKKTEPFYGKAAWQKKRQFIMDRYHGLDVWALYQGRYERAEAVHHIYPVKEFPDLAYNDDNLIPLSAQSHSYIEHQYELSPVSRQQTQQELKNALLWWSKTYEN